MKIDISVDNTGDSNATFIYLTNEDKYAIVEVVEYADSTNVYTTYFDKEKKKKSFPNVNLANAYTFEFIKAMITED